MRFVCLALILVGVGACDDSGTSPNQDLSIAVPHNFDQINSDVLQPLCASFSVCHSRVGEKDAGKLNLQDDPYTALVGVASTNAQALSEGKLRVKPCDPDNSLFWIKLNLPLTDKDPNVGYGQSMPKDNPHLPQPQLDAIHDWIARGAHLNEAPDVTGTTCVTDDAGIDLGHD